MFRAALGLLVVMTALFAAGCGGSNPKTMFSIPAGTGFSSLKSDPVGPNRKVTVRMDGEVTPGSTETLRIAHYPPRKKFVVLIGPNGGENGCRDQGISCSARVSPEPGTALFRSSRKGRAVARFVMPANYHKAQLPNGTVVADYPFENGQRISIAAGALGIEARHPLAFVGNRALATVVISP